MRPRALSIGIVFLLHSCADKDEEHATASAPPEQAAATAQPATPPPAVPQPTEAPADAGNTRPAQVKHEHVAAADAVGAWFATLTSAAQGAAGDCAAMASALQSVGTKGHPLVAKAKSAHKEYSKDSPARAWLADYTSEKMQTGYANLMEAIGPCAVNPKVKSAVKSVARR